ncbi:MAG: acetyltransferase [Leptolyngbyaceae cyanobacterium RU_5_1]|nr:acetyltransferase [Leptolyngbyaceae cyanobacterium RU_5_1]
MKHKQTATLIEILATQDLFDPFISGVLGQCHAGEELQDPTLYAKSELIFPSNEPLPRCWLDVNYRK